MNETTTTVIELWQFIALIIGMLMSAVVTFFALKSTVDKIGVRMEKAEDSIEKLDVKLDKEISQTHENNANIAQTLAILVNDMKYLKEGMQELKEKN